MRTRLAPALRHLHRDDDGQITAFVVVLVTAIIALSGLVLDGGLALAGKIRALGEAQEAARAGAQAIDLAAYRASGTVRLIPDEAISLAKEYLAAAGRNGTATVNGNTVSVTVTDTHRSILLGVVGVESINTSASAIAEPQRGISEPDP